MSEGGGGEGESVYWVGWVKWVGWDVGVCV